MRRLLYAQIISGALMLLPFLAIAQTSDIEAVITWRAHAYAPPGYAGKVFPTRNTEVTARIALLDNGKIASLANREIRWYVNDRYYHKGTGLTTFTFVVPIIATGNQTISAEIINYQGSDIRGTVLIPFNEPFVVIDMPAHVNLLAAAIYRLRALPYSFNTSTIDEFKFDWSANGVAATGDPGNANELTLNVSAGTSGNEVLVNLHATNSNAPIEQDTVSATLTIR